jgi:hypothetical protein
VVVGEALVVELVEVVLEEGEELVVVGEALVVELVEVVVEIGVNDRDTTTAVPLTVTTPKGGLAE